MSFKFDNNVWQIFINFFSSIIFATEIKRYFYVIYQVKIWHIFSFLLSEVNNISNPKTLSIWFFKLASSCLSFTWFGISRFFTFAIFCSRAYTFSIWLAVFVIFVLCTELLKVYERHININLLILLKSLFMVKISDSYLT